MATFTANVQGTYIVPIPLSANLTNITLNGALDGQQVVLEFQQNGTGGWTVASSTITGLQQPVLTPSTNSFQLFIFNSVLGEWQALRTVVATSFTTTSSGSPYTITLQGLTASSHVWLQAMNAAAALDQASGNVWVGTVSANSVVIDTGITSGEIFNVFGTVN